MGLATGKGYRTFLYVNTFVIVLLGAAVAGGCVFLLFPANLGQDYHSSLAALQAIRKVLFWRVLAVYAVVSLIILLSIMVLHLLYSHRIAGPTYRIGCEAAKIAQGNLTCNFTLRRKDNLMDLRDYLNELGCRYRGRVEAIQDGLAAIETNVETISADKRRQGQPDVACRQALAEITAATKEIERHLLEIRT